MRISGLVTAQGRIEPTGCAKSDLEVSADTARACCVGLILWPLHSGVHRFRVARVGPHQGEGALPPRPAGRCFRAQTPMISSGNESISISRRLPKTSLCEDPYQGQSSVFIECSRRAASLHGRRRQALAAGRCRFIALKTGKSQLARTKAHALIPARSRALRLLHGPFRTLRNRHCPDPRHMVDDARLSERTSFRGPAGRLGDNRRTAPSICLRLSSTSMVGTHGAGFSNAATRPGFACWWPELA